MNNNNKNLKNQPRKRRFDWGGLIFVILLLLCIYMFVSNSMRPDYKKIDYQTIEDIADDGTYSVTNGLYNSPFQPSVTEGQTFKVEFKEITATPLGGENGDNLEIKGKVVETLNGVSKEFYFTANITQEMYNILVINYGLNVELVQLTESIWLYLLINFVPYLIIGIVFFMIMRSSANANRQSFDFGKNRAKLAQGSPVKFNDVAGCDEEKDELVEVVDFLKDPKKYVDIGARIPKGILLSGPPGTGKTLLAKAVAGEAGVPFFSISGSDFVEMFVGVGASRVRDLFKQAKENAPCIIFIDEIDAVGRQRGAGIGGGHDEREQTLNQLLVEMDGFVPNSGIIMMAATNRPDVLDPALLRPGRFDRQITIAAPDVKGREAILKVHARNKKFASNVKFDEIAQRIPGFSGADIENLLNEAALLAARDNRKQINKFDIDEATDRVMMGPAKKSRMMSGEEKEIVAVHEAGHAVVGLKLKHSAVVQKVTIIPRGEAGGYNLMLPEKEKYLNTRSELRESITGYLAGRVAEELIFGEVTNGAYSDFKSATRIARAMVTEYGMSDLGPVQYESPQGSVFLGRDYTSAKNFSDQVALEIDREQRKIIEECYQQAKDCLTENNRLLLTIAEYLKRIETLTKPDIDEINETGHLSWYDKKNLDNPVIVEGKPVYTPTEEDLAQKAKEADEKKAEDQDTQIEVIDTTKEATQDNNDNNNNENR